jgi:Rrf2 family transcriptional regulator, iron-sulfur cluster assembly transcription factor
VISKSALYALRASVELAQLPAGTFATAAQVAQVCEAPATYLSKLLEVLIVRGLVRSRKGLHGGYALSRPSESITLFDIIDPIDHVSRLPECLLGHTQCSDAEPCPVRDRWRQVRGALTHMLATTTLADLRVISPSPPGLTAYSGLEPPEPGRPPKPPPKPPKPPPEPT